MGRLRIIGGLVLGSLWLSACSQPARLQPVNRAVSGAQQATVQAAAAIARRDTQTHFQTFDRNRDLALTTTEFVDGILQALLREADEPLDAADKALAKKDAALEFKSLDQNRDNRLSAGEFAARNAAPSASR